MGKRRSSPLTPGALATPVDYLFTCEQWAAIVERLDLSPREAQIVRLLMTEATELAIGDVLHISGHTVHTHLERLYRKLGVSTRCGMLVRVFAAYQELFPSFPGRLQ